MFAVKRRQTTFFSVGNSLETFSGIWLYKRHEVRSSFSTRALSSQNSDLVASDVFGYLDWGVVQPFSSAQEGNAATLRSCSNSRCEARNPRSRKRREAVP
jgi:hypothetical protein